VELFSDRIEVISRGPREGIARLKAEHAIPVFEVRSSVVKTLTANQKTILREMLTKNQVQVPDNRIEIVVATDNHKSQKVAEKVGAVREGVLRRRLMVRQNIYDAVMFSLVPTDLN
jgi:hypothetical protein